MEALRRYFSPDCGNAFANALPELRQRIASIQFCPHGSDFGVSGNTFRAYVRWPEPPSIVYREWAQGICTELNIETLEQKLGTADGFNVWHTALAGSLQEHWVHRQGRELSFAHTYKLIDLFIKWLSMRDFKSLQFSQCLVSYANCALDSQTLSKLNECLSMALPLSKPSMGDIHSMRTYEFCQALIEAFASHYGGTRLLFDYFAWRRGGGN
jgi:hypothetical protein